MQYKTLSQLVQEVIKSLSMYAGTSTQLYAEDRIAAMLVRLFNKLFEMQFWSEHTHWFNYELTGINGVCKEDVSKDIANIHDIYSITSTVNLKKSLRKLHQSTNPFEIKGNLPVYYTNTQEPNKVFAVVPYTATGKIYVQARVRPQNIDINTVIPFDPDVLVLGVCWEYCADDGNSSSQIQKFQQLYQERLKILQNNENSGTYDYNDEQAYIGSSEWR